MPNRTTLPQFVTKPRRREGRKTLAHLPNSAHKNLRTVAAGSTKLQKPKAHQPLTRAWKCSTYYILYTQKREIRTSDQHNFYEFSQQLTSEARKHWHHDITHLTIVLKTWKLTWKDTGKWRRPQIPTVTSTVVMRSEYRAGRRRRS